MFPTGKHLTKEEERKREMGYVELIGIWDYLTLGLNK